MSERDRTAIADVIAQGSEHRVASDRRGGRGASRRGQKVRPLWIRLLAIVGRDTLFAVGTVGAIIVSIRATHPIFANQPTVYESLVTAPIAPIVKAVLDTSPKDTSGRADIVALPEFERDRKAFAADLVATGHMDPARADTVAYYAVRESYLRGISPAVVFGVMLTENARFVSTALSNVGAVGLMQIYPKVWLKALEARLGSDLSADSTNLKYGVYILSRYIKTDHGQVAAGAVNTGLLHYNGCVRGTNTRRCYTYPSKVAGYVERQANSICGDKGFYECIAQPFVAGFMGVKTQ